MESFNYFPLRDDNNEGMNYVEALTSRCKFKLIETFVLAVLRKMGGINEKNWAF